MNEIRLFEELKEAYETSTLNNNRFAILINSIEWDCAYEADGEYCFEKDGFYIAVENLNPFMEAYKPWGVFSDRNTFQF